MVLPVLKKPSPRSRVSVARAPGFAAVVRCLVDATVASSTSPAPGFRARPLRDCRVGVAGSKGARSEEHTSELQSRSDIVCRLLLEKKKKSNRQPPITKPRPLVHFTAGLSASSRRCKCGSSIDGVCLGRCHYWHLSVHA